MNFEKIDEDASIFERDLSPERLIVALFLLLNTSITPGEKLLFFDEVKEALAYLVTGDN